MATLYELTEEYKQLLELAEDQYTDQTVLSDTLEALNGEIEEKADGYAKVIAELDAKAKMIKQEESRLADRRRSIEINKARIKTSLESAMVAMNKRKIKTDLFSFSIQKNTPALVIDDAKAIPQEYLIPQPDKVDNDAIKTALKSGTKYNWCHLAQSESLRIR